MAMVCLPGAGLYFTHHLLRLARARRGQVRRRAGLAVNLNFDFSGSRFFRRDDRRRCCR